MKKTTKRIIPAKKVSRNASLGVKTFEQEFYRDMFTLKMKPIPNDYLLHFALEWVTVTLKDEEMITIEDYLILKGVEQSTVDRWCKRSEELRAAHDYVLMILGNRREKGGLTRKFDAGLIKTTQHLYNIKWKELEEWRANLSAKIAQAHGGDKNFIIEMNTTPNSPLVPPKKQEGSL